MGYKNDNLKNFAIQLSLKVQEYIQSTTYIKLPLRASDLKHYYVVSKLVKEAGYNSLNQCLHLIVDHKLESLIEGFSYQRKMVGGVERFEWYFAKSKSSKDKKSLIAITSRKIVIELSDAENLYFSELEKTTLRKYKLQFENLINGEREPKTEMQNSFKDVAKSLLERHKEKLPPKAFYEKLIAKYILYKHYIAVKKINMPE
ncbi:MAG: hypothetical protein ACOYXT_29120 [Bacteroidota bacterium]